MIRGLLLLLIGAPQAFAADVDRFDPATSISTATGGLATESPVLGADGLWLGALANMAQDPVVRTYNDGSEEPVVRFLAPVHLAAGYTVAQRARIDLVLPVYAWVDSPLSQYAGTAVGDLRLQTTLSAYQSDALHFAVIPNISLPTGTSDALVAGGLQAGLAASLGADRRHVGWATSFGTDLSPGESLDDTAPLMGSNLDIDGAAWWHLREGLRVGAELAYEVGLVSNDVGNNSTGLGSLFASAKVPSGAALTVGAGRGLISGLGSPDFRIHGGLTWSGGVRDSDGDGITDDVDLCPQEPEDLDGFDDQDGCIELDNDGDMVLDVADACPMVPEDIDKFEDFDGCPDPDNDGDTVLDEEDLCPDVPGDPAAGGCPDPDGDGLLGEDDRCPDEPGPESTEGCPDADGDLVPDFRDKCPDEPKPEGEDPATSDGCPKIAFVIGDEIRITERVEFKTGSSALEKGASRVLEQVAQVLKDNPAVVKLEVQGHTDNVGSASSNERLSLRRAESVRNWLIRTGKVDAGILVAKGYGETTPRDSNRTASGRENNRRVQFQILESTKSEGTDAPGTPVRSPWGESGSEDGSSPWKPVTGEGEAPPPPPKPLDNPWGETNPE